MRRRRRLAAGLLVTVALPASAAGLAVASTTRPTALRLESARIAAGPQSIQVIARFSGGNVAPGIVMTSDTNPYDGHATVTVPAPRISTAVAAVHGAGVRVQMTARSDRLRFALTSAPRSITYAGYRRGMPGRLVLVLWRSTLPGRALTRASARPAA